MSDKGYVTHQADDDGRCIADGEEWPCSLCRRAVDFVDIEVTDQGRTV